MDDNKLVKQETIGFAIQSNNINEAAVEKVSKYLPELIDKTKAFGSQNKSDNHNDDDSDDACRSFSISYVTSDFSRGGERKVALSDSQVRHYKISKGN